MDFDFLLKILAKIIVVSTVKSLLTVQKNSVTDAIKTDSKGAIQKNAEAAGDLIGNEIADKMTSVSTECHSKKSPKELNSHKANNEIPKQRYISPKERQQIIDEIRLI